MQDRFRASDGSEGGLQLAELQGSVVDSTGTHEYLLGNDLHGGAGGRKGPDRMNEKLGKKKTLFASMRCRKNRKSVTGMNRGFV
jgi:hypothetical protein